MKDNQWWNVSWNPVVGCSPAGVGCASCWAAKMASRLARMPATQDLYRSVTAGGAWNGATSAAGPDVWGKPRSWKKPRKVFVCSMGDLFHETVKNSTIDNVDRVMRECSQHTFLVLTKRFKRMRDYTRREPFPSNVWCGMSASTHHEYELAIEMLPGTAARVRWLSIEPLVSAVELNRHDCLDWVVVGAESGPHRRPCNTEWVRDIVHQCKRAGVACFVKQLDIGGKLVKDPALFPEDLRVREYPSAR